MPTGIEWTDEVFNPTTGCTKVSQGCKHCYAETIAKRFWKGRPFTDVQCHADRLEKPLRWRKPKRIFVNSMSDLFHKDVPDEFIAEVWGIMAASPQHTFQLLTKRPERMRELLNNEPNQTIWDGSSFFEQVQLAWKDADTRSNIIKWPLPNVILGVSIEDQATADERIPLLLETPAACRMVSYEPALGPVDLGCLHHDGITNVDALRGQHGVLVPLRGKCSSLDWIVAGGESGPKARPAHPDWFRAIRDQCAAAGVPLLFKQWGEWLPDNQLDQSQFVVKRGHPGAPPDLIGKEVCNLSPGLHAFKAGKKRAGRLLDGRLHDEFPTLERDHETTPN